MFVGRERELGLLEEKYAASGGQLVFLWGRRRLGKTALLEHFAQGKQCVTFDCPDLPDFEIYRRFTGAVLGRPENSACRRHTGHGDWEEAFAALGDLAGSRQRLVVILEDFPLMFRNCPDAVPALVAAWKKKLAGANIMLILAGSQVSQIQQKMLAPDLPLAKILTGSIHLGPLGFYSVRQFFPDYSYDDQMAVFGVLGGSPRYLKQFEPDLPLEENLLRHLLTRDSFLFGEPEFVLRGELRELATYNFILEALARGSGRLCELSRRLSVTADTAKTSVYLRNLGFLEHVRRLPCVGELKAGRLPPGRAEFRFSDNFLRFWYYFLFRNVSRLERGEAAAILEQEIRPAMGAYLEQIFENVCREYLVIKRDEGSLPVTFGELGSRWPRIPGSDCGESSQDPDDEGEIQILGIAPGGDSCLAGVARYCGGPLGLEDYFRTAERASVGAEGQRFYCLFSGQGFTPDLEKEAARNSSIRLVNLEDLAECR